MALWLADHPDINSLFVTFLIRDVHPRLLSPTTPHFHSIRNVHQHPQPRPSRLRHPQGQHRLHHRRQRFLPHSPAHPPPLTLPGYIGSHIADQVLAAGFAVRGSVRSAAKGDAIAAVLTRRHPAATFAYVVVPDFAVPGAFDAHLRGCAGVIHTASDLTFAPDPERIIKPVVAALRSVLASAQAAGVRRFVYTSSSTAALMPTLEKRFTVDAATWNDATVDKVWREHAAGKEVDGFDVYSASKCSAERAAWEFMEKEKPGFVLNCVLPK